MRIRITFKKTEAMRFIGHLDLYRAWERTFRRAGLPLAYSQGFKPHPRINLASALPLGITGCNEVIEFWLENDLPLEEIEQRVKKAFPPGLGIVQIESIESGEPSLQSKVVASEYTITLLEPIEDLDRRISAVLQAENLRRERRNKIYDLRPLIVKISQVPDESKSLQKITVVLKTEEKATGRPEEIISVLGGRPERARIQRERIFFRESTDQS